MRLSDLDREELIEQLKIHAAAGRIELDELERRVAVVVGAQTRDEAEAVLADLPPLPSSAQRSPRWGRGHGHADAPEPGWRPTGERFRDPRTGRVMRVWVDRGGGRHYVLDEV